MKKRCVSLFAVFALLISLVPCVALNVSASATKWDVINPRGISGSDIVAQARTYMGAPYDTSGGNYLYRTGFGSTLMFDCSGFVYRVCRDVGLVSSRQNYTMGINDPSGRPLEGQDSAGRYYITAHTQEQRYYGTDISAAVSKYMQTGDYSDLMPGDLLFTTNDNSSVSHVVIYAGNGTIIHCEGYEGCVAIHDVSRYHSSHNKSNWYFDGCRLVSDINTSEPEAILSDFSFPNLLKRESTPNLSGTITANRPLKWVWIGVDTEDNQSVISTEANPFTYSFDITSLTSTMQFSKLNSGDYIFKIHAILEGEYFVLCIQPFSVADDGEVYAKNISFPSKISVGEKVTLSGQVLSSAPMNWVWIGIDTLDNQNVQSFESNPYTTKFDVSDANGTINTSGLSQGTYVFKIHVIINGKYYIAYYKEFTVGNPTITVTFNANGGSCSTLSKAVTTGLPYGTLPTPTRTDYTFDGWYTAASGSSKVTSSTTVTATTNHILYAHWTSVCANGHDYTYTVTTAPTVSATGVLTGTCSRCSATTTVTLPKLNTTDYTYAVTKAATCTATGTGRYTWKTTTYGSLYFDVTLEKAAHTYKNTVTAPTCIAQGYTTHTCSLCGDNYKDTYTDALGHNWNEGIVTTQPTETSEGAKTFTCLRCGATKTEPIPMLTHTHSYTAGVTKPTCTEQGYTTYTCTCGDSYKDNYTNALGHNWNEGIVTTQPTETSEGTKTFTCSRCGATKTEPIPMLTHTHSYTAGVTKPTCTEQGYTTYTCTCGDSYKDNYTNALGHNWNEGIVTTQPTETSEGTKTFTCSRCGAERTENIPPLTHTHSFSAVTTPPTCTEKGYTTYTCTCGDSYVTDYVGALGHNFVNGVCTRCGTDDPNYKPSTDPCEGYTDINRSGWYHTAADFVISRGLMGSTKTDSLVFEPNTKVSRAMVASILYRMAGSPEVAFKGTFDDVKYGQWFTNAIEWCAQSGLASGKGDGKFDPNGNVTRQELAVFMMKMAQYLKKDTSGSDALTSFADASKVPSWAKNYVAWAVCAGLISGKSSNGKTYLAPTDNASRAEFASIIMRFVQNIAEA